MRKETWLITVVLCTMYYISTPSLGELSTQQREIPECLQKLMDCLEEHVDNDSKDPKFDSDSPEYDVKAYVCCPLMQQIVVPQKECLCSSVATPFFFFLLDDIVGKPAKNESDSGTRALKLCNVVDDSVPSLAAFCKDSAAQLLSNENTTTTSTNSAQGRKYISTTFTTLLTTLICLFIQLYN